ncbi:hypothetical protein KBC40_00810 [Patescibacteria group bacterium]|nr:hypothetical protein [Patescibacteria group bacterium]
MNKSRKFIVTLMLAIFLVGPAALVVPQRTYAQGVDPVQAALQPAWWIWQKIEDAYDFLQKRIGSQVINNTVKTYVNNLAYNIASSIAEGAEGGKSLFRRESIKDSLQKSKEAAIGEFITSLQDNTFADLGFNLCEPSLELKLSLTLKLIDSKAPPAPDCEWRDVQKKWSQFSGQLKEGDIDNFIKVKLSSQGTAKDWDDFWSSFDASNSDLGIAQGLVEKLNEAEMTAADVAKMTAEECKGFRDVSSPIAGQVKTHCMTVLTINEKQWDLIIDPEVQRLERLAKEDAVKLSDILKDAGQYFMKTLSSKMLKYALQWGQSCVGNLSECFNDKDGSFRDSLLTQLRGGADLNRPARGADIFRDLFAVEFEEVESFNLLENFAICPDQADFRHPDNCVITGEFLQAISQQKTLAQLIDEGTLNPNTAFFGSSDTRNNSDSCYNQGFCYHNLIKLRKANVIPVGWEMAASLSPAGQAVTLGELLACFENQGCPYYSGVEGSFNPYYHLVDPNWVLKIPPARCEALAYAPTLESKESNTRQEYCADVTTCLREDDEGNCLDSQYGYCVRSENIWRLDADRCEDGEIYSGCLTFDNGEESMSYLEQTLDYCTADEVGCKRYSQEQDANNAWLLQDIASDNDDLFLNDKAADCPSDQAGCHEFIVMASGLGVNLLPNGSFEYDASAWSSPNLSIVSDAYLGAKAGSFQNSLSTGFESGVPLKNRKFIFSFQAKASSPNNFTFVVSTSTGELFSQTFDITPDWQSESFSINFPINIQATSFNINILGAGAILDAVKLEEVGANQTLASSFTNYGDGARIFMNDDRQMCLLEEVGCRGYFPANGDPMIPGVIASGDLCPSECVGYASFAQSPNIFDVLENDLDTEYYNLIPDTARECPSSEVGCEEFTNLDIVSKGGEGKEYYSYLRQCVPMSAGNIATYYTWEGQDVSGYQLKTWTFLQSDVDAGPCTNVAPGTNTCIDSDDVSLMAVCGPDTADPADDPNVNPNCREFFDTEGNAFYRLEDRLIYASAECVSFRRASTGQEYQAIANLSHSCQAQYAGCRWYAGESANNVRQVFLDNFENNTYSPWSGASLDLSNESLANGGHSLKVNANATLSRTLSSLQNDKAYQLSWWMKTTANISSVRVFLTDGSEEYELGILESVSANTWRNYQVSSGENFNFNELDNLSLRFELNGVGEIFLDNILLKEVVDNLSLVKNSWSTPVSCDTPFTGAYLGCQAYQDTNGTDYSLKSFASLCREDSIGCVAAIDTQNSLNPFAETFHSGLDSQLNLPADSLVYLVPKVENYCPQGYKGCSALGLPQMDQANNLIKVNADGQQLYSTVYKINNPDNYAQSLCTSDALYCESYNSDKGVYYFQDPGNKNCSYKKNLNINGVLWNGWFKTDSLATSPIGCSDDEDGQLNALDLELVSDWAASCPDDKNLCTTFSDPLDNNKPYYYYNNNKIDLSSCAGQFDQNNGCILLRDENNWNGEHSEIINQYNTLDTYDLNVEQNAAVAPITTGILDANKLVQVRRDRQCAEWLACKSSTAVLDPKTNSYKIVCDAIDSCTDFNTASNISQCAQWSTYGDTAPLDIAEYQNRATGENSHLTWSDKEYLGYSLPNFLPVKDLVSYNFAADENETDLRLVYQTDVTCTPAQDLDIDQINLRGLGTYPATCKDGLYWLNPKADEEVVKLSTRAYATQDAPFASSIIDNESKQTVEKAQAFIEANICEDGTNGCEPGYQKVTYSASGFVKYFANGNEDTSKSVCTIIGEDENVEKEEGDFCEQNSQCGGIGGRCSPPSKIEKFLNWEGICLEADLSTNIPEDGAQGVALKNYCNQWYPVGQIQGAQSLYNNFTTAGFYNESGNSLEMCAVGEEFVTQADRYYCGSTENGFGVDTGFSCTVLLKVPANSKIKLNQIASFGVFAYGNYLTNNAFVFESSVEGVRKVGADNACSGENDDNRDRGECVTEGAFFESQDFGGHNSFEGIVINPVDLASLFASVTGEIEYYYFDEAVEGDGTWNLDEGDSGSDNDKVLANGAQIYEDEDSCNDWDVDICPGGFHQVEVRDWRGSSHCGLYGARKQYGTRYCNPLAYNYYVKTDSSISDLTCTETNCAGPERGRECLRSEDAYSGITVPSAGCGTDANCLFKRCVESLPNPLATPYCSEYGNIEQTCDWSGCTPTNVQGCLASIFQVSGGVLNARAGVNADLLDEVDLCLDSDIEDSCTAAGGYEVDQPGASCSGLECLQQCEVISQIGAEGDRDLSWVRTDIWWRSSQNATFNRGWQAYYYDGASYARSAVYFDSTNINTPNISKYFGSAQGSSSASPVVTQAPLSTQENPNEAAIFFGRDFNTARAQMQYLFARLYNLTWSGGSYTGGITDPVNGVYDVQVNQDAGPDYNPMIYKVCGNGLCPEAQTGITVNAQNGQNVVGRRAVDTDLRFFYHAHPDHMPIVNIGVDWGDGTVRGDLAGSFIQRYKNNMPADYCDPNVEIRGKGRMGFAGTQEACQAGYKTFYHPYVYKPDAEYACDGSGGRPNILNAACYQPSVSVTDNWERVSSVDYDAWVVVYQQ